MNGSLVYQDYINLINKNFIITENIQNTQIQPSSIDLSLSDRSEMNYPILLGRKFLNDRFIVDVSKKYLSLNNKGS